MADNPTFAPIAARAPLFNEDQAAEFLSVSVRTLQRWRWEGIGPAFVKVGARAVRYDQAELAAFLNRGRVATTDARAVA